MTKKFKNKIRNKYWCRVQKSLSAGTSVWMDLSLKLQKTLQNHGIVENQPLEM